MIMSYEYGDDIIVFFNQVNKCVITLFIKIITVIIIKLNLVEIDHNHSISGTVQYLFQPGKTAFKIVPVNTG